MASMGSLFPQPYSADNAKPPGPRPGRKRQRSAQARVQGSSDNADRSGDQRAQRARGQQSRGRGQRWADPEWRKAEIGRRSRTAASGDHRTLPSVASDAAAEAAALAAAAAHSLLGDEQRRVLAAVVERRANVFFTGNAGTGKSFLLRAIVAQLQRAHSQRGVFVTASTGIAAANVGGMTLHSFAGIGLGEDDAATMERTMKTKPRARWREARVLVIDEVSMLDGRLLDKLDALARGVRNRPDESFGGIQLVLCGDFFQLPPVRLGQDPAVRFCFQSTCWDEVVCETFVLQKVYRQRDTDFLAMLDEVRHGTVGPASERLLQKAHSQTVSQEASGENDDDGIKATRLYATNRNVDALNERELSQLSGCAQTYTAQDKGETNARRHLEQNCLAPTHLVLKVGAQVMLLKNLDVEKSLTNGSRGVVVGWTAHARPLPVVRFTAVASEKVTERVIGPEQWTIDEGGKQLAERTQLPLKLAWAITIHKSQGMTISKLELEISDVFEPGMAYVALSRAVSLEGLQLRGYDVNSIRAHPDVERFYASLDRRLSGGSTNGHAAAARGAAAEADGQKQEDTSFGSIDWDAVDLSVLDKQMDVAAAAIVATHRVEDLTQLGSDEDDDEDDDLLLSLAGGAAAATTSSSSSPVGRQATRWIWNGRLRIAVAGDYKFASCGPQPFNVIVDGVRQLSNGTISHANVELSAGEHQMRVVDTSGSNGSVAQELAWSPSPGAAATETLWRRGGYWSECGECAPPLFEDASQREREREREWRDN